MRCDYCGENINLTSTRKRVIKPSGDIRIYHFPCSIIEQLEERIKILEKITNARREKQNEKI
jgi:hypothetical protein